MDYCVSNDFYQFSSNLDKNNKSYIYGEVNPIDIIDVLKELNYENYSFLDIGSGCGKIILSIAHELNIFCTGVEIDISRYNRSIELLDKINVEHNVEFFNNDFKNIYFGNYDIIYCANTVFVKEDNILLYNEILREFNGYLFLFDYDYSLKKYLICQKNIKTSWSKNVVMYIFFIY